MIKNREQIHGLVEAPLLSTCEELYDKNIRTLSTSANKKDIESGMPGHIIIDFDTLSNENLKIAKQLGEVEDSDGKKALVIEIPVSKDSSLEEIKRHAKLIAEKFKKQSMTWAPRYTLEELKEIYMFDPSDESIGIDDFKDEYYYDGDSKLFYLSEEHFKKVNEKIED